MATLAEKAQALTRTTRVIVSFGARDGGFELTAQLRLDIMDRYGRRRVIRDPAGKWLRTEADDAFCYLDAITLAQAEGTSYDKLALDRKLAGDPTRKVAIDLNKMANPFWDTYYPAAVANAAVMIFQVTTPWLESAFCLEEFGWFIVNALKNMEQGQSSACIFMVFPEAQAAFGELLNKLRMGLRASHAASALPGERYKRMLEALKAVQVSFADVARGGASHRIAMLQANADRLLNDMRARILPVPEGYGALGFDDFYDANEQRIVLDAQGSRPDSTAYQHRFEYRYNITQQFQQDLFRLLDADLAKVGIHPAPS